MFSDRYGLSTGRPSMANTLADVESVYDYLVNTYMDRCDRIIAYGNRRFASQNFRACPFVNVLIFAHILFFVV